MRHRKLKVNRFTSRWNTLFEYKGTPTKVTWVNPQITGFTVDGDGEMPGEGLP